MSTFHRTHYKKIELSEDISLRYFFTFDDIPNFENKWVIKSHNKKKYGEINRTVAELIAESHGKTLSDYIEIIGRQINNNSYMKIIIKKTKSGKRKTKVITTPNEYREDK